MDLPSQNSLEKRLEVLQKNDSQMFIPKKLVSVKTAGQTIMGYPEIDHTAPAAERVYALMVNRQAARDAFLSTVQEVAFYSGRTGIEVQSGVLITQWHSRLVNNWADPAQLTVISYHGADGAVINDAIDPDTGVLRPIDDGPAGTRRPAGVTSAQVRLTLNFTDLHHNNEPTECVMTYFIQLPVGTIVFENAAGNQVTRVTCNIPGDPFALTPAEFKNQVLLPCGTNGPAKLKAPDMGGGACGYDEAAKGKELKERIISVGSESIYLKLREQLAPGFHTSVFATVEKITMAYKDDEGNSVSLTVHEFYNAMLRAASTFIHDEVFSYNLANHFANNLEPSIKALFEQKTKAHLVFSDFNRDAQLKQLDVYVALAMTCEKQVNDTAKLVRKTVGDTHTFYGKALQALGLNIDETMDLSDPSTFISAAEKTLQKYKPVSPEKPNSKDPVCWGCKGGHSYRDKRSKEVTCPNKDKPGVAERAKLMHKQYLEKLKEMKKGWVKKSKMKFSQLSEEEKESGRQYFVEQAQKLQSFNTSNTPTGHNYPAIVILSATCKAPLLPVDLDCKLPHISIVLGGLEDSLEQCAVVRALYDSGASLTSGYAGFWLPILKAHPEIIVEMYSSKGGEYTPIVLGGIVVGDDGDMKGHTTELDIVVKVKLRYETVTHQPVAHTIAIGSSVGVNTIVGKPFQKALQCIHDSYNGTVEARLLDTAPFVVTEMHPQRYDTTDKVKGASGNPNYAAIVQTLEKYSKAMIAPADVASSKTSESSLFDSDSASSVDTEVEKRGSVIWGKAKEVKPRKKRIRFEDNDVPLNCLRDDYIHDE